MMGKSGKSRSHNELADQLVAAYASTIPARSRRSERRRLLALQRKAAKLNRSINRLEKVTG